MRVFFDADADELLGRKACWAEARHHFLRPVRMRPHMVGVHADVAAGLLLDALPAQNAVGCASVLKDDGFSACQQGHDSTHVTSLSPPAQERHVHRAAAALLKPHVEAHVGAVVGGMPFWPVVDLWSNTRRDRAPAQLSGDLAEANAADV